jgi:hypothetical protein
MEGQQTSKLNIHFYMNRIMNKYILLAAMAVKGKYDPLHVLFQNTCKNARDSLTDKLLSQ